MTVIMSPQKIPFFAGTYFPKSSLLDMLPHFARVWREDRAKVNDIGRVIIENLEHAQASKTGGDLNATHLDRCMDKLYESYDKQYGGFGKRPKFPSPHALSFLLRYHARTGSEDALNMVTHTLSQIRLGGTYDQIGWGIHRYSTDREWLLPHFEKMLYDQALFAIASMETYQVTQDPFFKEVCENTLEYVNRDLSSPNGGFYSAEDADSEGEEGKFYLWTVDQLTSILGPEDAEIFSRFFHCEQFGNYFDEATGEKNGMNIPHLGRRLTKKKDISDKKNREIILVLESIRKKLFATRERRLRPQLDDKVLTDWNGLMISAFARAGQAFANSSYTARARKAADFCLAELRQTNGRLYKRWSMGRAGMPGHLDDYAFLTQGLLDLYESCLNPHYLEQAIALLDLTRIHFEDPEIGGFFLTANDGEPLLTRPKEIYDGAIPSGNSVMAMNLARVWKISGDEKYLDCLTRTFVAFSGFISSNPAGAENLLNALAFVLHPPEEIVITGNQGNFSSSEIIKEVHARFLPFKTLLYLPSEIENSPLLDIAPHLVNFDLSSEPTFFLCRDFSCEKPLTNIKEIRKALDKLSIPWEGSE